MNDVLPLVALVALATAMAVLLERGGRAGYGWVTGSEFALLGVILGPVVLDLLSSDLLDGLSTAIWAGAAWLGLRFGMRLRRSFLEGMSWRTQCASQLEPVLTLFALRGLLRLLDLRGWLLLDNDVAWAIAAVGSATTKSATAWARTRLGAKGPTTDALESVSTLDDWPAVIGAAVLMPRLHPLPSRLPPFAWGPLAATLVIGLGLGLLILLLTSGKRFRGDLGWVAMFGACALASGLSASLGLSSVAITTFAGLMVGGFSAHADALEALTRATERPVVLTLLVLGGASLVGGAWLAVVGAAAALLRALAKLVGGALAGAVLPKAARRVDFGAGLLGSGGVSFAVAMTLAQGLGNDRRDAILVSAVAMALFGDWVGTALLRRVLARAGELSVKPDAAPAPVEVSP